MNKKALISIDLSYVKAIPALFKLLCAAESAGSEARKALPTLSSLRMSGRYLVLVTGASRGFGKHLAVEFVRTIQDKAVDLHLVARTQSGLAETETEVPKRQGVNVWQWPVDLGDLDGLPVKMDEIFSKIDPAVYERAYLFNNAGSLGPLTFVQELDGELSAMRRAVDMNLTAFMYLTSLFTQRFGAPRPDLPKDKLSPAALKAGEWEGKAVVVNVSSLAAVQPFASWGIYCAGKAGRDMFCNVLAAEQAHTDKLKALNYAPGPMDTDMQGEVRGNEDADQTGRQWFLEMHKEGKLVCPRESAAKCIRILQADRYKSGAHIDFYDEEP